MTHHEPQPTTWLDRQKAGLAEAKEHIDEGAQRQRDVQSGRVMPAGWYPNPLDAKLEAYWDGAHWSTFVRPTQQRVTSTNVAALAWLVAIVSFGYMLPWAVACSRDMPNQGAIGLVNLLTGWTGVGWLVALVMASVQRQP